MAEFKRDCKSFPGTYACEIMTAEGYKDCSECIFYEPIKKKILIIQFGAMGDVIRTTSIIPAIKEKYGRDRVGTLPTFSAYTFSFSLATKPVKSGCATEYMSMIIITENIAIHALSAIMFFLLFIFLISFLISGSMPRLILDFYPAALLPGLF